MRTTVIACALVFAALPARAANWPEHPILHAVRVAKPPVVDGVVLGITSSGSGDELVEVSIGADDGLLVGNTLEVFRDKKYLGRLEILRTSPDRARAP